MRWIAASLASIVFPVLACADGQVPTGTWQTEKYLDATAISQSDSYIRSFLKKKLVVTQESIRFAGDQCKIQSRQELKTDDEAAKFFLAEKINYSALRIHAPVSYIDADCAFIVVDSTGTVLFNWDGNTYLMSRVKKHR